MGQEQGLRRKDFDKKGRGKIMEALCNLSRCARYVIQLEKRGREGKNER